MIWISLFNRGKSFLRGLPNSFYDICNQHELVSGCCFGKIFVLFIIADFTQKKLHPGKNSLYVFLSKTHRALDDLMP